MERHGPRPLLEEYALALRVCDSPPLAAELQKRLDGVILRDQVLRCGKEEWRQILELMKDMEELRLVPDQVL